MQWFEKWKVDTSVSCLLTHEHINTSTRIALVKALTLLLPVLQILSVLWHFSGWSKLRRREDPNARLVSELWGPVVLDASNTDNGSFFLGAERATNNTGELCAVRGSAATPGGTPVVVLDTDGTICTLQQGLQY